MSVMYQRTKPVRRAAPGISRAGLDILSRLAQKTRFADPALSEHWTTIVGRELAAQCRPGRITGRAGDGMLEVCAPSGAAAAFVQMQSDLLIDLVNRFAGPGTIRHLRIRQLTPATPEDPALGAALASFRAAVKRRESDKDPEN